MYRIAKQTTMCVCKLYTIMVVNLALYVKTCVVASVGSMLVQCNKASVKHSSICSVVVAEYVYLPCPVFECRARLTLIEFMGHRMVNQTKNVSVFFVTLYHKPDKGIQYIQNANRY